MGNLGSIANMLKRIGYESKITDNLNEIKNAKKIILPGIGHFDKAMNNLKELGFVEILNKKVLEDKIPVLGICLGMQLLANKSEEGNLSGLGWIHGEVKKFSFGGLPENKLKIPHMGWNLVHLKKDNPLVNNMYHEPRFYFVHSYHFQCSNEADVLATTYYGYYFPSIIAKSNIIGVQFHPEKSHKFGMKLLKNFVEYY